MNIPATDYPALIEIINQTYTSGLDAILAAKMVGQNKMLVLGQDGSKQLAIELSPQNIAIKWINSGQKPPKKGAESFGEVSLDDALLNAAVVSMAQLVGIDLPQSFSEAPMLDLDEEYAEGKAFKCSPKSISCKGRCISGWKVCREGMSMKYAGILDDMLKRLKKAEKAGTVDEVAEASIAKFKAAAARLQEMRAAGDNDADFQQVAVMIKKEKDLKAKMEAEAMKPAIDKILESPSADGDGTVGDSLKAKMAEDEPMPSIEALAAKAKANILANKKKAAAAKKLEADLKAEAEAEAKEELPKAKPKTDKALIKEAGNWIDDEEDDEPYQNMRKDGLTDGEARAITSWTGIQSRAMNRAIYTRGTSDAYSPSEQKSLDALNELAIRAYGKMKPITADSMAKAAAKEGHEDEWDPAQPIVSRGFKPGVGEGRVEAFLKPYQDALAGNGEIIEKTYFASSYRSSVAEGFAGGIMFKITPKLDGTGRARYLEQYKEEYDEGEVMFTPGTKFRVKAVVPPNSTPEPEPPDDMLSDWMHSNITTALDGKKKGFPLKQAMGSSFGILPKEVKKMDDSQVQKWLDGQNIVRAEYKKAMAEYKKGGDPNNHTIEIEEI
jgi:hypothetical protein